LNCPECNTEVSDQAQSCPQCGYNLSILTLKKTIEQNKQNQCLLNMANIIVLYKKAKSIMNNLIVTGIAFILPFLIPSVNGPVQSQKIFIPAAILFIGNLIVSFIRTKNQKKYSKEIRDCIGSSVIKISQEDANQFFIPLETNVSFKAENRDLLYADIYVKAFELGADAIVSGEVSTSTYTTVRSDNGKIKSNTESFDSSSVSYYKLK